jgi:hypothetical protein
MHKDTLSLAIKFDKCAVINISKPEGRILG